MRRGTHTKVARSISAAPTKYAYVSSMARDLDIMVRTLRDWATNEHDAVSEGRANFNYGKYFAELADVLDNASDKARKIASAVE